MDVVLTQNDLQTDTNLINANAEILLSHQNPLSLLPPRPLSYLRRSCIKATADRPVTIFTREMSVFEHFAALRGENKVIVAQNQLKFLDDY